MPRIHRTRTGLALLLMAVSAVGLSPSVGAIAAPGPVPHAKLVAAQSAMAEALRQAMAGQNDKAKTQAKKAIDGIVTAGGKDAPELVALLTQRARIDGMIGDEAAEKKDALEATRIAMIAPSDVDGGADLQAELGEVVRRAFDMHIGTDEEHKLARTYVALLEHEAAPNDTLADAWLLVASSTSIEQMGEQQKALEKRIKLVETDHAPGSIEAVMARIDAADMVAAEAGLEARSDTTRGAKLVAIAEGFLTPIDPTKVEAEARMQYAGTLLTITSAYAATRAEKPLLAPADADHAIGLLDRADKALAVAPEETIGDRAEIVGTEALALAAAGRVPEARDRYKQALAIIENAPKDASIMATPSFFDGLLAFLDTPLTSSAEGARCQLASAKAPPPKPPATPKPPKPPVPQPPDDPPMDDPPMDDGGEPAEGTDTPDTIFGVTPICADPPAIADLAAHGAEVAKRVGDPDAEALFHGKLGVALCAARDGEGARRELDVALGHVREGGDPYALAREEYAEARVLVACNAAAAEVRVTEAIGLGEDPSDDADVAAFDAFAEQAWLSSGQVHRIARVANALLEHADKVDTSGAKRGRASLAVAERFLAMGDGARAKPLFEAAIKYIEGGGEVSETEAETFAPIVRAHLGLGRANLLAGDLDAASHELGVAISKIDPAAPGGNGLLALYVTLARTDRARGDAEALGKTATAVIGLIDPETTAKADLLALGRVLADGAPAASDGFYDGLARKFSRDREVLLETARYRSARSDHAGARKLLEDAYSKDPKDPELDCALMSELVATGEGGAAGLLADKLGHDFDPAHAAAARSLGCLVDYLSHAGKIADSDALVRRAFEEEAKASKGAPALGVALAAMWAYRAAGDGERAAKWGAIYQRAMDRFAAGETPATPLDVALARDLEAGPTLLEVQVATKAQSKAAVEGALETAIRRHGRHASSAPGVADPKVAAALPRLGAIQSEAAVSVALGSKPAKDAEAAAKEASDLMAVLVDGDLEGPAGLALDVEAVRARLPADAALVDIELVAPIAPNASRATAFAPLSIGAPGEETREEARYVAYVLPKKGDVKYFEIGKAKDVDAQTKRLLDAFADPKSEPGEPARALYASIVTPIAQAAPSARQLLIVPDGSLSLVPLAALSGPDHVPLIADRAVSYLGSARDLFKKPGGVEGTPGVVVVAPDFTKGDGKSPLPPGSTPADFTEIAGGKKLAEELKKALPDAKLYAGESATEGALKTVRSPAVLVVATNAWFVPRDEKRAKGALLERDLRGEDATFAADLPFLRSGLVLAGAKAGGQDGDDGFFTGLEATRVDLRGTKLVVLPTCNTTRAPGGAEGSASLRRALADAGAETVVTSLWSGDAASAATILTRMQTHLGKGLGRGEALRLAQAEIAADARTSHPYYWASFVSYGATGAMTGAEGKSAQNDVDKLHLRPGGCACELGASGEVDGRAFAFVGLALAFAARRRRAARD